jgi:aminopeptidase N
VGRTVGSLIAAGAAVLIALPVTASARGFTHGSAGLGDPFFPRAGNGGYDVGHYALRLRYAPRAGALRATEKLHAAATQGLSRFDLDFRGPHVSALSVDGRPASFRRRGQELIVTPRSGIRDGKRFTVRLRYRGRPGPVTDPDGSKDGWIPTADGAFVADEPQGAPTWFACNDYPTDKASYDFRVTVPRGITAVANGRLARRAPHRRHTTFVWREGAPMATYLATLTTGRFRVHRSRANGIPSYVAVDPAQANADSTLSKVGSILALFGDKFGAYPFGQTGAIVDNAPSVGYALETQTRPLFERAPGEITLAHELSHQWFGDAVTIARWPDIWLNEGFATWAEWFWGQHEGGPSTQARFDGLYSSHGQGDTSFWDPPPGNPGSAVNLFDGTIYDRGGMTLEALREKVGDAEFFQILRDWAAEHRFGNATTQDFISLAETDSGLDLDHFFQVWLFDEGKPASW